MCAGANQLGHSKISDFCNSSLPSEKNVVARECMMDDAIVVEVSQCQRDTVAKVDLHVEGNRQRGPLQEGG